MTMEGVLEFDRIFMYIRMTDKTLHLSGKNTLPISFPIFNIVEIFLAWIVAFYSHVYNGVVSK